MVDKIKPLKIEEATGGTQVNLFPTEADPTEDYASVKGVAFENSDNTTIRGDSGVMKFKDSENPADRTLSQLINSQYKQSVKVASTANLTLSGEQTVDGISTSADRILVKDQSTGSENGIYLTAAGAWARESDLPSGDPAKSILVVIEEGTANADSVWCCTNNSGSDVVGTDALVFIRIGSPIYSDYQTAHVSKAGNDTTGNGSLENPYLTIGQALTDITDASSTKRYMITVWPGIYTENVVLKNYVYLYGFNKSTTRIENSSGDTVSITGGSVESGLYHISILSTSSTATDSAVFVGLDSILFTVHADVVNAGTGTALTLQDVGGGSAGGIIDSQDSRFEGFLYGVDAGDVAIGILDGGRVSGTTDDFNLSASSLISITASVSTPGTLTIAGAGSLTLDTPASFVRNDSGVTGTSVKDALDTLDGTAVAGPGSSTDNAVARFDGTGGKTLQNSGVTISDNDEIRHAGTVEEDKGADLASATTLTLGTDGNYFDVTGTTTITAISAKAIGTEITLQFDAAAQLTHHATNLILAGGSNFTSAVGDHMTLRNYDGTNWREVSRGVTPPAGGSPAVTQANATSNTTTTSGTAVVIGSMTITPGAGDYLVTFNASFSHSANNGSITYSIFVNAVEVAGSQRSWSRGAGQGNVTTPATIIHKVTGVGASEAIDIRWLTSSATATCEERTMTVTKTA